MAKAKNKTSGAHSVPRRRLTPIERLYLAAGAGTGLDLDAADASVLLNFIESMCERARDSEQALDILIARSPSHQSRALH